MVSYEENYLSKCPHSLCKMCGRYCRVLSTAIPYKKLKELYENGDERAKDFLFLFESYKSADEARLVDSQAVDNIINLLSKSGDYNEETVVFYFCKYLADDNSCSNCENNNILCHHCLSAPWVAVPKEHGLDGRMFLKCEEDKQKVRQAKEELLELKLLRSRTKDKEALKRIDIVEQKIQRNIDMYKKYGSENW